MSKPNILLIYTGGTIGMIEDFESKALKPFDFESRENSRKTVTAVYNDKHRYQPEFTLNQGILIGYELINKKLDLLESARDIENKSAESISVKEFADYLFEFVQIVRVEVPSDTDLNHYFEIMNSRGEQLEKHEILKYRLIKTLDGIENETEKNQAKYSFNQIWEACSNMEKYLPMYFSVKDKRVKLFGKNWTEFKPTDFNHFTSIVYEESGNSAQKKSSVLTLSDLITPKAINVSNSKDETPNEERERYRDLRDEERDLNYEMRDIERTKRDLEYQSKRADAQTQKEIKEELKALEKKKAKFEKSKNSIQKEVAKVRAEQQKLIEEQEKQRTSFYQGLKVSLTQTLCLYGNGLKALPSNEHVSLILKSGGDKEGRRYKDQIYVFDKKDISACSADKINVDALLAKAKHYQF